MLPRCRTQGHENLTATGSYLSHDYKASLGNGKYSAGNVRIPYTAAMRHTLHWHTLRFAP
jgi:hypothetical protein